MLDAISPQRRSWNMSRIRSRNTRPEIIVRSMLHRMGYRFSLSSKAVPGRPDILLPKFKIAIFVHGCFWHRHASCKNAYTPKSRIAFWQQKFEGNRRRDREVARKFRGLGWARFVIWECEVCKPAWQSRFSKLIGRRSTPQSHE
jgi:DNA mismatch endonuclease, patch repair protein